MIQEAVVVGGGEQVEKKSKIWQCFLQQPDIERKFQGVVEEQF